MVHVESMVYLRHFGSPVAAERSDQRGLAVPTTLHRRCTDGRQKHVEKREKILAHQCGWLRDGLMGHGEVALPRGARCLWPARPPFARRSRAETPLFYFGTLGINAHARGLGGLRELNDHCRTVSSPTRNHEAHMHPSELNPLFPYVFQPTPGGDVS